MEVAKQTDLRATGRESRDACAVGSRREPGTCFAARESARDRSAQPQVSTPEVVLELRTDPGEVGMIRATIRSPEWTRNAWYAAEGVPLRQDATPFVPPALLAAMRHRARLVVDGDVSPLLLSNLRAIQAMFCVMRPRWRVIDVRATPGNP
ncbi:MAG: hypothetical protein QOI60_779, partial [Actinomycetota bacterium]|nr:hypothetical protein [Actinomycetota bacterium]